MDCCNNNRDDTRSCLWSSVMLAVIVDVSISIPRKVRRVVGPSIFDGFTGRVGQYYDIIVYRDIEVSR